MIKEVIRERMRRRRKTLTNEQVHEKSETIRYKLEGRKAFKEAETIMMYISSFKEPETLPIIEHLLEQGKKVVVPVSSTATNTIVPTYIESISELQKGAYGILEPSIIRHVDPSEIEVVVIPGIAFDMHRNRLGFGKGYYDKFLENTEAKKIALCYDFQIVDDLPVDDHDIPMDLILTEKGEV